MNKMSKKLLCETKEIIFNTYYRNKIIFETLIAITGVKLLQIKL